jgi:hypothetical protein
MCIRFVGICCTAAVGRWWTLFLSIFKSGLLLIKTTQNIRAARRYVNYVPYLNLTEHSIDLRVLHTRRQRDHGSLNRSLDRWSPASKSETGICVANGFLGTKLPPYSSACSRGHDTIAGDRGGGAMPVPDGGSRMEPRRPYVRTPFLFSLGGGIGAINDGIGLSTAFLGNTAVMLLAFFPASRSCPQLRRPCNWTLMLRSGGWHQLTANSYNRFMRLPPKQTVRAHPSRPSRVFLRA